MKSLLYQSASTVFAVGDVVSFTVNGVRVKDVVREISRAERLLMPYAPNDSVPALILTSHSWVDPDDEDVRLEEPSQYGPARCQTLIGMKAVSRFAANVLFRRTMARPSPVPDDGKRTPNRSLLY